MKMKRLTPVLLGLGILVIPPTACDSSIQGPWDDDDGGNEQSYSHKRSVGASANDLLAGDKFTSLVVEVDFMTGFEPDAGALDLLGDFLAARLNKSSVTIRAPTEIPAEGQQAYTLDEIRALENHHRDEFTEGSRLVAYMLIVDGEFEQANVLGVAHLNTSTAYFGAALDAVSGGLTQPTRRQAEASVFRHEFGHLLGLVAIPGSGTDMQTDHQDEAHGHHCDDDTCLMYYAVESTDLFASVFGGSIPELDANCLADLEANGGK